MRKQLVKMANSYLDDLEKRGYNLSGRSVMYYYDEVFNGDNTIDAVLTVKINGEEELMIRANIAR